MPADRRRAGAYTPGVSDAPTRVAIIGQGYVGLPVAMRACEVGHDVVGFDVDERRVKRLATGESMVEDVSDERLAAALEKRARSLPAGLTPVSRSRKLFDHLVRRGFDPGAVREALREKGDPTDDDPL